MTAPACPSSRMVAGQRIACTEGSPVHRGPHGGPGTGGVVGAAWCDLPCSGRLCRGPCHDGDPGCAAIAPTGGGLAGA